MELDDDVVGKCLAEVSKMQFGQQNRSMTVNTREQSSAVRASSQFVLLQLASTIIKQSHRKDRKSASTPINKEVDLLDPSHSLVTFACFRIAPCIQLQFNICLNARSRTKRVHSRVNMNRLQSWLPGEGEGH